MSPRSQEYWAEARDRLASAHASLESGFSSVATSAAHYAMLYAARAALSERERSAKTHSGVWTIFAETFVAPGDFEHALVAGARRIQRLREGGDYDALRITSAEAGDALAHAEAFLDAIERLISD